MSTAFRGSLLRVPRPVDMSSLAIKFSLIIIIPTMCNNDYNADLRY